MQIRCWEVDTYSKCGLRSSKVPKWDRIWANAVTGMGYPTTETRLSYPLTVRNFSFCTIPMVKGGNKSIRRASGDGAQNQKGDPFLDPSIYKNETNQLQWGSFLKFNTIWRHHYAIISRPANGSHGELLQKPTVVVIRGGQNDRGAGEVRNEVLLERNKSFELGCEAALLASSSDDIPSAAATASRTDTTSTSTSTSAVNDVAAQPIHSAHQQVIEAESAASAASSTAILSTLLTRLENHLRVYL